MSVKIQTLGSFRVFRNGQLITDSEWKTQKNKKLLKILITHSGRTLTKDQLIEWLWPGLSPDAADHNVRVAISHLRRLLEPDLPPRQPSGFIITGDSGYQWNSKSDCICDADQFAALCANLDSEVASKTRSLDEQIADAEKARQHYAGDYMEEDRYADWATSEREKLRELFLALLTRKAELHAQLGRYRQAIADSREVLSHDPCRESTYCQMMLYEYLAGDQSGAIRAYDQCVKTLRKELDVGPGTQTEQLYKQILAGRVLVVEKSFPIPPTIKHAIPYTLSQENVAFVGRERELELLADHLRQSSRGAGSLVLVGGEAGVGKSRLIRQFLAQIPTILGGPCQVFNSRGSELSVMQPYNICSQIAHNALAQLKERLLMLMPEDELAEIAKILPELREQFPGLPANPPLPPEQEHFRLVGSLNKFLLRLASDTEHEGPTLFVLDDLHWADARSLEFLGNVLSQIDDKPVLLIGTYRAGELGPDHRLQKLISSVQPEKHIHNIELSRLSAADVIDLFKGFPIAMKNQERLAGRLYQETGGNPLFLIATLQSLFEEGLLRVEGSSWVAHSDEVLSEQRQMAIPPSIKELIARRLSRLQEPESRLIKLAAVIGHDLESRLVELAWEGEAAESISALASLVRSQLLAESGNRYQFSHSKIREVVYDQIAPGLRELLHQRVLRTLEQFHAERLENVQVLLAGHARQAQDWRKVLEYALPALKRALAIYSLHQGLQLAQLGIEATDALETTTPETERSDVDRQRFELLVLRSEIYQRSGQLREEESDLTELRHLAARMGDPNREAQAVQMEGALLNRMAKYSDAESAYKSAEALYGSLGERSGKWLAALGLGNVYQNSGQYEKAESSYRQALRICHDIRDQRGEGLTLNNIARLQMNRGKLTDALGSYQEALKIQRGLGDRDAETGLLINIAGIQRRFGRYDESKTFYAEALELTKGTWNRHLQSAALVGLGLNHWSLGRFQEALVHQQMALKIYTESNRPRDRGLVLLNIGNLFRSLGRYDESRTSLEASLAIRREIGDLEGQATTLANLGLVSVEMENYEMALQELHESLGISRQLGRRWGVAFSLYVMGDAHFGLGRFEEALSRYQEALVLFVEMAERPMELVCLSAEGKTHLQLGALDQALTASSKAIELLRAGEICSTPQEITYPHFQILLKLGRHSEALESLQRAYDEVMRRANLISDSDLRQCFLDRVRLNAQIVKSWRELHQ